MEDIIWKRLKNLQSDDLNIVYYYKLDIDLNYQEIELLYKNYVTKHYFNEKKENIFSNNETDKISLKLSLFEPTLSQVFEDLFHDNVKIIEDDGIVIYIKDQDNALVLFKSFFPLSEINEIRLPHFCYYIKNNTFINNLKRDFKDEESICIISCSN